MTIAVDATKQQQEEYSSREVWCMSRKQGWSIFRQRKF